MLQLLTNQVKLKNKTQMVLSRVIFLNSNDISFI